MRRNEKSVGSIRALLLILALLCANILSHPERSAAESRNPVAQPRGAVAAPGLTKSVPPKTGNEAVSVPHRDSSTAPSTSLGMTDVASAFKQ
jgi:hypothetical protein